MKTNPFLTTGHLPELVAQIRQSRPGMAHFAATCGQCAYLGYWRQRRSANGDTVKTERTGGCEKFHQLTGKHGAVVPPGTEACRYFQRRES